MRRTAAYLFHLAIATLTIPIVALNLGALLYRLTNKALSPHGTRCIAEQAITLRLRHILIF